jgi:hypothetical protein
MELQVKITYAVRALEDPPPEQSFGIDDSYSVVLQIAEKMCCFSAVKPVPWSLLEPSATERRPTVCAHAKHAVNGATSRTLSPSSNLREWAGARTRLSDTRCDSRLADRAP